MKQLVVELFLIVLIFVGGMACGFNIDRGDIVSLEQMVEEMADLPKSPYPVLLMVIDLEEYDAYGMCNRIEKGRKYPTRTFSGPHYVILIDDDCSTEIASFILVHEFAHVLAWEAEVRDGDHSAAWGEAYARCYLAMFSED